MGSRSLNRLSTRSVDFPSASSGNSPPLSIEYMRWMVQMQTRAVLSIWLLVRCWTMYSSPNL